MLKVFLETLFDELSEEEDIEIRTIRKGDGKTTAKSFWYSSTDQLIKDEHKLKELDNSGTDIYFGVNPRLHGKGGSKGAIGRVFTLWADLDNGDIDAALCKYFPQPSAIISSGRGYHIYWFLSIPDIDFKRVEIVTKDIASRIGADNINDVSRILRIPNTKNHKYNPPKKCRVTAFSGIKYSLDYLERALSVPEKVAKKIYYGDSRGYKSRSELDFAILLALKRAGFTDNEVIEIFEEYDKIGIDDSGEKKTDHYFTHTLDNVKDVLEKEKNAAWGILQRDGEVCRVSKSGKETIISTFSFTPTKILAGREKEDQVLVGTITDSFGNTTYDVAIPKNAFSSARDFSLALEDTNWVWMGNSGDTARYLAHLANYINENGVPKQEFSKRLGMHFYNGKHIWLFDGDSIPRDSGLVYLSLKTEHPDLVYEEVTKDDIIGALTLFLDLYPKINRSDVVWPVLGWFFASMIKPKIVESGYQFPILNLYGTRGAGKTTLIKFLQPIVGYKKPITYDCNTTRFVLLVHLTSTTSIPVALSEYRVSTLRRNGSDITRMILLSYDGGKDSRGRGNQTTVEYELTSPITIDGEDAITDPASLERVIQINMNPATIADGSDAYKSFTELKQLDIQGNMSRALVKFAISYTPNLEHREELIRNSLSIKLPDRVRRNLAVTLEGLFFFREFVKSYELDFPVSLGKHFIVSNFLPICKNVVDMSTGRTPVALDDFVVDMISELGMSFGVPEDFVARYRRGVVYFHLPTAHNWWLKKRRMEGKDVLQLQAIKRQLNESDYIEKAKTVTINGKSWHCYGINTEKAKEFLDIPNFDDLVQITSNRRKKHEGVAIQ